MNTGSLVGRKKITHEDEHSLASRAVPLPRGRYSPPDLETLPLGLHTLGASNTMILTL
jgi:hypothetical protein